MNDAPVAKAVEGKLRQAFAPAALEIVDESARHAGHAGARGQGESHFRVRIVAEGFAGLSRIERQRKIYALLAPEMEAGLHALALTVLTPEEAARR